MKLNIRVPRRGYMNCIYHGVRSRHAISTARSQTVYRGPQQGISDHIIEPPMVVVVVVVMVVVVVIAVVVALAHSSHIDCVGVHYSSVVCWCLDWACWVDNPTLSAHCM